ncbi:hypothetical protein ARTHRO9AX_220261 [Arthrobacter sp. 9AX]|nr:hypothetical protein ARTHRO9AX_220261 [Arthrobacter sp. 9AX]
MECYANGKTGSPRIGRALAHLATMGLSVLATVGRCMTAVQLPDRHTDEGPGPHPWTLPGGGHRLCCRRAPCCRAPCCIVIVVPPAIESRACYCLRLVS